MVASFLRENMRGYEIVGIFWETKIFPRAKLEENCELQGYC